MTLQLIINTLSIIFTILSAFLVISYVFYIKNIKFNNNKNISYTEIIRMMVSTIGITHIALIPRYIIQHQFKFLIVYIIAIIIMTKIRSYEIHLSTYYQCIKSDYLSYPNVIFNTKYLSTIFILITLILTFDMSYLCFTRQYILKIIIDCVQNINTLESIKLILLVVTMIITMLFILPIIVYMCINHKKYILLFTNIVLCILIIVYIINIKSYDFMFISNYFTDNIYSYSYIVDAIKTSAYSSEILACFIPSIICEEYKNNLTKYNIKLVIRRYVDANIISSILNCIFAIIISFITYHSYYNYKNINSDNIIFIFNLLFKTSFLENIIIINILMLLITSISNAIYTYSMPCIVNIYKNFKHNIYTQAIISIIISFIIFINFEYIFGSKTIHIAQDIMCMLYHIVQCLNAVIFSVGIIKHYKKINLFFKEEAGLEPTSIS